MDPRFLILAVCMVITGSINTLSTKWADNTYSVGIDGTSRQFNHPFVQAAGMFLGEFLCMIAFYVTIAYRKCKEQEIERAKFNPLIFVLPAICDMTATSLMYVGLSMTYASVFQMLRGAVVIFTGILSLVFLKRKLYAFHWIGMVLVLCGLATVGLASVLFPDQSSDNASNPLLGDVIIICAQVVVAIQMVIEEKFISKYNIPPLQVVGWEGLFGFSILSCILVVMYYIPGNSAGNHFENTPDAFVQLGNSTIVLVAIIGNIFSIAFFNFFGISITKYANATTRMVMDSIRTIVIWGVDLIIGWEKFQYLQIIGFILLILGTLLYNQVLPGFILHGFVYKYLGNPELKKIEAEEERQSLLTGETPSVQESSRRDSRF